MQVILHLPDVPQALGVDITCLSEKGTRHCIPLQLVSPREKWRGEGKAPLFVLSLSEGLLVAGAGKQGLQCCAVVQ